MTQFFERNKRKSALAALLLLLGRRRDAGLLLLMVALLLFVFVLPANFSTLVGRRLARLPGGSVLATMLGVNKPSFAELMAAFREARNEPRLPWRMFFQPGARPSSSVDMVLGSKSDLAGSGEVTAPIGPNATIHGILDQDQAGRTVAGVYLGAQDPGGERASLVQSAVGAGFEALGGIGAFASPGFFSGAARAAAPDGFSAALGTTQVPAASPVSQGPVRLSRAARQALAWSPLAESVGRGMAGTSSSGGACLSGGRCAFTQLTTGHTDAMLSSSPVCAPGNGCPPEYAAAQSGAVYDNNLISATPQVITSGSAAPELDGISTPDPTAPSQGTADGYNQQADQLDLAQQQCDQAQQTYEPQEEALQGQIQELSDNANSLNCGGGGCSAPGQCQSDGNQMTSVCQQLNGVMYAHYQACPLMQQNGPYQPQPCN